MVFTKYFNVPKSYKTGISASAEPYVGLAALEWVGVKLSETKIHQLLMKTMTILVKYVFALRKCLVAGEVTEIWDASPKGRNIFMQ